MFWHYQNAGESTIRMLLLFYLKLCKNWWCSCKSFWWHCLYWEKSVLSVLLTHLQKNKDLFLFPGDMYISAHSPSFSKALKEKKSILSLSESQCLLLMRNCRNSQASSRNAHVALWLESIQQLPSCSSMHKNENIVYPSVFLIVKSQL